MPVKLIGLYSYLVNRHLKVAAYFIEKCRLRVKIRLYFTHKQLMIESEIEVHIEQFPIHNYPNKVTVYFNEVRAI